jgi:hypothetical protein
MTTVGVFSLMPLPGSVGRLAVYARALARHGATVHRILCDGSQPRCATDTFLSTLPHRFGHCPGCFAGNRWLTTLGDSDAATEALLTLSSLIDYDRQQAVLAEIAALPDTAVRSWTFAGHPCGLWLDNAMRSDYYGLFWQQMPDWATIARDWLGTMVTGMLAVESYIRRYQPDVLLIPNGRLPADRGILAVAKAQGIPVYTEDTGLRPQHYAIRLDSPACDFDFAPEWAQWADVPLTPDEEAHLDALLQDRQTPQHPNAFAYSPAPTGRLADVRQDLHLEAERPLIAVFTGILADTSQYNADRIFAHQAVWLDAVMRLADQRPDWDVVIRLHPVDVANHVRRQGRLVPIPDRLGPILADTWPALPANVRVIQPESPISSHDLLGISRLVLTYVSTVGLEATLRGLPVVLGGWPHYAQTGLAWTLQSPEDLAPCVDRLMAHPEQPAEAITKARRYLYLSQVRGMYHFPFFQTAEPDPYLPAEMQRLAIHAAEGAGDLARLCEVILGRRALVDPPPGQPPRRHAPVPAQERQLEPLHPPARLTVAVAIPDDNGYPIEWASLGQLADELLVITGPQRRVPPGLPANVRLITAPAGDLASCWQSALATAESDWVLLLQAGEQVQASVQDLQAITRLRPLSPAIGLAAMRAGHVPAGTWWEPRLVSRNGPWRITGQVWPRLLPAEAGQTIGGQAFVMPTIPIRSRLALPARTALHRSLAWLRTGLAARPDSVLWQQALSEALRTAYPLAAQRHDPQSESRQPRSVRLSVAILVSPATPLSQLTLTAIDALADDLLVVTGPHGQVSRGLVASYAGRLIEAPSADLHSLLTTARQEARGTWLLVLHGGEMPAPGMTEAMGVWLQTVGATKNGALIACQDWPQAGVASPRRPEQRLWRQGTDDRASTLNPLTIVPGTAIWQAPKADTAAMIPSIPAAVAPPPASLVPAVLRLLQGDLTGARSDLLAWRQTAPTDDPDREACDEWLITTALALGDWSLALTVADGVLTARCRRPVLAIQAATALQLVGDVPGAAQACRLAVAARQDGAAVPAEVAWQPEMLLASLMLGIDGADVVAAWMSQAPAWGPLAVMQALLSWLQGQAREVPETRVMDLAAELVDGGWLVPATLTDLRAEA